MFSAKKKEELQALNDQVKILDNYNAWLEKQNYIFNSKIEDKENKLEYLKYKSADLEEFANAKKVGSSILQILLLLIVSMLYALPEYLPDYLDKLSLAVFLSGLVSPLLIIRRSSRSKRPFATNLLCILGTGISYLVAFSILTLVKNDMSAIKEISLSSLLSGDVFDIIGPIYSIMSLAFALSLIVISIFKKVRVNRIIKHATLEYIDAIDEITDLEVTLNKQKDEFSTLIKEKEKEYFKKYPIILPKYSSEEVKEIIEVYKRRDIKDLKKAIKVYKGGKHA